MKPQDALDVVAICDGIVTRYSLDNNFRTALLTRRMAEKETDTLLRLRGYAEAQLKLEALKVKLEDLTSTITAEYKELTETILPELMEQCGVPNIALSENTSLKVVNKVGASMSKEKASAGCEWLVENGHGAIVKHQVVVNFGVRESDAAIKAAAALKELGLSPETTKSVHHSTLSAWARERLEAGDEIPIELFGIYERKVSTITVK